MATARTQIDAIGIYHTGGEYDGMPQNDADHCLGGFRSSTELRRLSALIENAIPPIRVDWISGACGEGAAFLRAASAESVQFAAPGGNFGNSVSIANGETMLIAGHTASRAIRIARDRADALGSRRGRIMTLTLQRIFNNAVAHRNVTAAERVTGLDTYSALMLRNHSDQTVNDIKIWIRELATPTTSDVSALGASGAGQLQTTGSFADWPQFGWCAIYTAGETLREIVYYRKTSSTRLDVDNGHRGRLGTSADAGATDDTLHCVPGVRIADEATVANAIQTIPDTTTGPAGLTWTTEITSGSGLSIATLAVGENHGMWIHREIPPTAFLAPEYKTALYLQFEYNSATYTDELYGSWRLAGSPNRYEVYVSSDHVIDPATSPLATTGNGPYFTLSAPPPVSGIAESYICVIRRNAYGLRGLNRRGRKIAIDETGARVSGYPSEPLNMSIADAGGGASLLSAEYFGDNDSGDAADHFAVYVRGDDINPDPDTDSPLIVPMRQRGLFGRAQNGLRLVLGPFAQRLDLRVLVRTRRNADGMSSQNTAPIQYQVSSLKPARVGSHTQHIGRDADQELTGDLIDRTVYIDETKNVYWRMRNGTTDLWADTMLIWRLRYDANQPATNGLWTTFAFKQRALSGSQSDVVEIGSWNGSKTIQIASHNQTRMIIDVTNGEIQAGAMIQNPNKVRLSRSDEPAHDFVWDTCFQVFEPNRFDYFTGMSLDANGGWRLAVPFRQRADVGDIP